MFWLWSTHQIRPGMEEPLQNTCTHCTIWWQLKCRKCQCWKKHLHKLKTKHTNHCQQYNVIFVNFSSTNNEPWTVNFPKQNYSMWFMHTINMRDGCTWARPMPNANFASAFKRVNESSNPISKSCNHKPKILSQKFYELNLGQYVCPLAGGRTRRTR